MLILGAVNLMAEYITKDAVISLFEKWSDGYAYIEMPVQDAIRQVSAIPPADVVPWSFLERYADWLYALVQYPEFIREAKRFYLDSTVAMEGGNIDG